MKKYAVIVTEEVVYEVEVTAESAEAAGEKAEQLVINIEPLEFFSHVRERDVESVELVDGPSDEESE